ncbi:hypothetical protein B0H10DRAFT_2206319 [Mycena sp. CBHHK59/15]|nr:hypothetical protein B0H10DRAFT_2206319 [Mycena sp. CBHHK59/15]
MPSALTRHCTIDCKTDKTMYDTFIKEAEALGDTNLGAHKIFPAKPDQKGNIHFEKAALLSWQILSRKSDLRLRELGWQPIQKTLLHLNFDSQPYTDMTSKSHKMVLALRCPTGAPEPLRTMYRDGVAVCDAICARDEEHEGEKGEQFEITDWISCGKGDENTVDKMILLAWLDQTYEIPHSNNTDTSSRSSRTPRRMITKVGSATTSCDGAADVDMEAMQVTKRKVGDYYPPDQLPDHQGPYFAHNKAKLVQRDYKDVDGTLIAPCELYSKLTEGTLVLVTVSLVTYIITDQKNEKGDPKPDKKIYHVLVDRLRILDHGDGEAWNPPVPALPECRYYSPATPKRGRDAAANAAFDGFGSKSLPSPKTLRRR